LKSALFTLLISEKDNKLPCGAVVQIENLKSNELKIIEMDAAEILFFDR
jgi:hypothetical protein